MVVYLQKYNIIPEKREAWSKWAQVEIPNILKSPGLLDMSVHRPCTGEHEIAILYTFASLADWSAWINSETMQRLLIESRSYELDINFELWDSSPVIPSRLQGHHD